MRPSAPACSPTTLQSDRTTPGTQSFIAQNAIREYQAVAGFSGDWNFGAISAVRSVRPAAEAKGIKVAVHIDERIRMAADPDRLQQVVWNLVSNAVKFTPRGGSISVHVQRNDSRAFIKVSDSGEGIDAEFLPHVFEPFRQADASKAREHKGLGLGLSIVKALVEAHGGTISVSSPGKGQGTTFCVALPIMPFTRDAADADETDAESLDDNDWAVVLPDRDALAGMTILVVDDRQPTLDLLTSVLRRSGASVFSATSAGEGYKLLRSFKPDLVLSDRNQRKFVRARGNAGFTLFTSCLEGVEERPA